MKKTFNKKVASVLLATSALGILGVGSFAYFTDRASTSVEANAGTVQLTPDWSTIKLTDEDGQDIYNPGDARALKFTISNDGNKSVDVRTTIKLTSSVQMEDDENGQAEFDIYEASDVELVEGEGYKPKADAEPIAVKTLAEDGMSTTYVIPDYVLNGNADAPAQETEDSIDTDSHTYDYVLVMRGTSGNDFQSANVKIDILAEAKQHRNTSAGWSTVAQESFTVGEITQDAVPAR